MDNFGQPCSGTVIFPLIDVLRAACRFTENVPKPRSSIRSPLESALAIELSTMSMQSSADL